MVVHAFNPSTQEAQAGDCYEFEASLVYIESPRPAKYTQWDPVSSAKKQFMIKLANSHEKDEVSEHNTLH